MLSTFAKQVHSSALPIAVSPAIERITVSTSSAKREAVGASRTVIQSIARVCCWLPPGKTAFPYHKHFTNEEAIYVLAGKGTIRLDDKELLVGPGDYIALPPEGPNHQLVNSGGDDLEYLCLSTMIHPDITLFPDSDKVIAFAGSGPGGDKSTRTFFGIYKANSAVDYYEGE